MSTHELELCIMQHGRDIYSFCFHLAGSRLEAEELYQDTFLLAMEKLHTIDGTKNPKSYLLSIALRLWKNRKRKYAWRERIAGKVSFEESRDESEADSGPTPEEQCLAREQDRLVRTAVQELDEKYRLPVYLYYMEDLSLQEISAMLHIPRGTVKSRLYEARRQLKRKLEAL